MSTSRPRSRFRFTFRAVAGAAATALLLSACGSDGGGDDEAGSDEAGGETQADPTADVTISVGWMPPTEQQELRAAFLDRVERFEDENPNITVEPEETRWQAETFQAMMAGGTMPTVMHVPVTEPPGLIERSQIADITAEFEQIESFSSLNEQLLQFGQDEEGRVYGVPVESYSLGLAYNRQLFEDAGLDPDDPPTTWDEVRAAAQTITEETGAAGYVQETTDNTGGWMYTSMLYSFGGSVQEVDGDGVRASFNSDEGKAVLEYLRALRWDDDSMGDTFLLNQAQLRELFAAGNVGMYIDGPNGYDNLVTNLGFDGDLFGFSALPQQGGEHGTLGGGAVAIVRADATPEERLAAMKWVELNYLNRYFDEELARSSSETRVAEGLPVGVPALVPVSSEQEERRNEWISEFINVPLEHFEPYTSTVNSLPIIAEPPVRAQETYAVLDPVIQAVLTQEDADIDQLLTDAAAQVDNLVSQ